MAGARVVAAGLVEFGELFVGLGEAGDVVEFFEFQKGAGELGFGGFELVEGEMGAAKIEIVGGDAVFVAEALIALEGGAEEVEDAFFVGRVAPGEEVKGEIVFDGGGDGGGLGGECEGFVAGFDGEIKFGLGAGALGEAGEVLGDGEVAFGEPVEGERCFVGINRGVNLAGALGGLGAVVQGIGLAGGVVEGGVGGGGVGEELGGGTPVLPGKGVMTAGDGAVGLHAQGAGFGRRFGAGTAGE